MCDNKLYKIFRKLSAGRRYTMMLHTTLIKDNDKVGAVVLLRNKKLTKKGSKMEPNWIGPYVVHEVLSIGTCRLSQVKKPNKVLAQKFNTSRLKLYHQNGLLTMSLYFVH